MGLLWALGIGTAWVWSVGMGLHLAIAETSVWAIGLMVFIRAFFQTGLFILAHDAMHGSLIPHYPYLNPVIGRFLLGLYAFLSYDKSCANHWKHHCYPAEARDPDFCTVIHSNEGIQLIIWYFKFLAEYLSVSQFFVLVGGWTIAFSCAHYFWQVAVENIVLFWILPLILSSMQLFYFGTYLPHRHPQNQVGPLHSVRSLDYPVVISFFACYHLGYHAEHHANPDRPWYQLPALYAQQQHPSPFKFS